MNIKHIIKFSIFATFQQPYEAGLNKSVAYKKSLYVTKRSVYLSFSIVIVHLFDRNCITQKRNWEKS